jgi:raffinose/stachyose/melibiose transport system permease protein
MKSNSSIKPYIFILPALLFYGTFTLYPLVAVTFYSFMNWEGVASRGFIGVSNYYSIFNTGEIGNEITRAFRHNLNFFAGNMLVQMVIGLLLAVLLSNKIKGKRFFQTSSALPFLINPLAIGYIWTLLLNPLNGPIASLLTSIGKDNWIRPWIADPNYVQPLVVLINAWQWVGFPMLVFGAAIAAIPDDIILAAKVDGASRLQSFRYITFPLLTPAIGTLTLLTFIGSFNAFNLQYAIGGINGSPAGETDVLSLVFYRLAFGSNLNSIGLSSALAVLTFLFVFSVAILLRKITSIAESRIS